MFSCFFLLKLKLMSLLYAFICTTFLTFTIWMSHSDIDIPVSISLNSPTHTWEYSFRRQKSVVYVFFCRTISIVKTLNEMKSQTIDPFSKYSWISVSKKYLFSLISHAQCVLIGNSRLDVRQKIIHRSFLLVSK
jgi:hypothetical protein